HLVIATQLVVSLQQILLLHGRGHVRVEMRERNSRGFRMFDLGAQLQRRFFRLGMGTYIGFEKREVAVLIQQTRHFVPRTDRSPAKMRPLAVQRKVDTEIGAWMRFSPVGDFWEPRAGN